MKLTNVFRYFLMAFALLGYLDVKTTMPLMQIWMRCLALRVLL